MSFMLLGILNSQAGSAGSKYFLATYSSSSIYSIEHRDTTVLYAIGASGGLFVAELNELGVEDSQFGLSGTARGDFSGFDSSGNLYICGYSRDGSSRSKPAVFKYNSSNVLQFQRNFLRSTSSSVFPGGFTVDSGGNSCFVMGRSAGIFGTAAATRKIDSSGSEQISIEFRKSSGFAQFEGVATDSGSNIYNLGRATESVVGAYLVKTNSTGTVSFQKNYAPASGNVENFTKIATDSSGNCYLAFPHGSGLNILKTNSSGTIQWQKKLEVGSNTTAIEIDPAGNIVVVATGVIFKFDSSGNLVWQRTLTRNGSNFSFRNLTFDSNSDIYFAGLSAFGYLPADGSLTGSYTLDGVNFVYSESSYTWSTPSFSEVSSTYSLELESPSQDDTILSASSPSNTLTLENL